MKREIVIKALMLLAISGMIFSGCGKTEETYVSQKKTETEISMVLCQDLAQNKMRSSAN